MASRFGQVVDLCRKRLGRDVPDAAQALPLPAHDLRLAFVICGIEHSGTTLVSDLFRQIPGLDSGFETGVLLAPSPRDFLNEMPFAAHILGGWAITQEELRACCDTDEFRIFYARIGKVSRSIEPGCLSVFDKTPRYLAQLGSCLGRAAVPFVVTHKDPRSIVFSDFTRSGALTFDGWFEGYVEPKLGYLRHLYRNYKDVALPNRRICSVALESLCMQPRRACEAMFSHCGQEFRLEYLLLQNLRYHHTRSDTISPCIPLEYLRALSKEQQRKITTHFAEFDDWFYE